MKATVVILLTLAAGGAAFGQPAGGLASPMVDRRLYRDDAVQRSAVTFGQWTLTCDEIKQLRRRFCSLRSAASGRISADVSTGDDGRPSILLHLPLAVSLSFGVKAEVAAEPALRGGRMSRRLASPPARGINIASCDRRECLAVWSLAAGEIQALDSGRGLAITYCTPKAVPLEFAPDLAVSGCATKVSGWLPGTGFAAAVEASLR